MLRFSFLFAAVLLACAPLTASAQVEETAYSVRLLSTAGSFEGIIQFGEDEDGDRRNGMEAGLAAISVGPDAPDVFGEYTSIEEMDGTTSVEFVGEDEDGASVRFSAVVDGRKISGQGFSGSGAIFKISGRSIRIPRR